MITSSNSCSNPYFSLSSLIHFSNSRSIFTYPDYKQHPPNIYFNYYNFIKNNSIIRQHIRKLRTRYKKIIALSTLRQIAIIIFAISIKSTTLAFFHLIIHALFKSTIFLCAGIIIHNFSYQDIRIIDIKINNSP